MPVSNTEIIEQDTMPDGRVRLKLKFTLQDGREFNAGYVYVNSESETQALIDSKAQALTESIKTSDAKDAVNLGIKTAYKEASQNDVYFAYLFDGFNNDDILESYNIMSQVADEILSLGLTVDQMAEMFNQDVDMAQAVINKWSYLSTNKDVIIAYGEL